MAFGIDYSYGSGLTAAQMKAAGVTFVCRYLSYQPNGKNISRAEFDNLVSAGLKVVLVWEQTGHDGKGGRAWGLAHAHEADRQAAALGAHGIPIYFAPADYDAPPSDQPAINAYLDGCGSVIGHGRVGMYGGFWPLSRALDAGHASYAWQTYAWSGTNVDRRARIYQYHNAARLGPAEVDYDKTFDFSDFGQWPRPRVTAPPPAPAHAPPAAKPEGPPYRHVAPSPPGESLGKVAEDRNVTVGHILSVSQGPLTDDHWKVLQAYSALEEAMIAAKMTRPVMPGGLIWYTDNP